MPKIPAPNHPNFHPDRDILSLAAMKADYQTLPDRAQAADWSRVDIAIALMVQEAENNFLAMETAIVLAAPKPH
ncbi:hypothetical protein [Ensifer canadensis]